MALQRRAVVPSSRRRTAPEGSRLSVLAARAGPRSNGRSRGGSVRAGCGRARRSQPAPLALDVIGFGDVDRDQPVLMAGQHRRRCAGSSAGSARKSKARPVRNIFARVASGSPSRSKRVEQPVLGDLERSPARQVARLRQVWNDAVVTAGDAEQFRRVRRDEPVAGLVDRRSRRGGTGCRAPPAPASDRLRAPAR